MVRLMKKGWPAIECFAKQMLPEGGSEEAVDNEMINQIPRSQPQQKREEKKTISWKHDAKIQE